MTPDSFRTALPAILSLLKASPLEDDIAAAISFAQEREEWLREALEAGVFKLNELMWLLVGVISPGLFDPAGETLEGDLSVIAANVGPEVVRSTYRNKLLVNDKNTLEYTRYEIAMTAKACGVLDQGSIELERPIPDEKKRHQHWKNTDVYGTFNGEPVRIEVTVIHESRPGVIHLDLDDIARAAGERGQAFQGGWPITLAGSEGRERG